MPEINRLPSFNRFKKVDGIYATGRFLRSLLLSCSASWFAGMRNIRRHKKARNITEPVKASQVVAFSLFICITQESVPSLTWPSYGLIVSACCRPTVTSTATGRLKKMDQETFMPNWAPMRHEDRSLSSSGVGVTGSFLLP
jgi:hypothetical protein